MYRRPTVSQVQEIVRNHDKRVGMRMLYAKFDIPEEKRHLYRRLWDEFYKMMPDAYGKEQEDASENRETTEDDGDSPASTGQAIQEEQEGSEDEQEATA